MATTIQIKTAIDTAGSAKSVQELRKAIKQLEAVGLQLGDQTSKEFKQIASAVGDAKERIEDLRDDFVAFQGSALEKFNGGLTVAREKLQNLEFDEVSKQLGNLGKIVAANPLLFLSKAVIELIENFESLKASGGIVGDVFTAIGDILDGLISLVKEIGDAIGLTAFEAEEASQRIVDSYKRINEQLTITYDNQIKLARAAGKETIDLELEKQKAIIETQKVIGAEILKRIRVEGRFATDEEKKQLKEVFDALRAAVVEGEALRLADNQKKLEEQKKTNDEILANELKLQRQIEDIRNSEIQNEFDRNAEILKTNADRDIQEIKALKAKESTKAIARLEVEKKLNLDLEVNEQARQAALNKIVEEGRIAQEKIIKDSIARIEEEETQLVKKGYVPGLGWVDEKKAQELNEQRKLLDEGTQAQAIQYGQELAKFGSFLVQTAQENNRRETEDLLNNLKIRKDAAAANLEERQNAEEISDADFKRKQAENEKRFRAEELKIQREAFEKQKRLQLTLLAINLASEISAIAVSSAANPLNAVTSGAAGIIQFSTLSALAIARSAVQAAQIRNQKFAKGGILNGPSHEQGGIATPFGEMEGGEAVINKEGTRKFRPLLSAINSSTGGVRFAGGGMTPSQQQLELAQQTITSNEPGVLKAYVVQSEIVEQNKRVSKIQGLNGV